MGERVVEELNDDVIERAEDFSGICFDHENNIPIKKEIKQEIKPEPLDKDNIDFETNSCENDQEKRDLQAMVDKLLIEKQKLQKEKDYFKGKLEDKVKEFEELQVKNQHLKSDKKVVERQLEEKEKKFQDLSLHCSQLQLTIMNLKENKNNNSKKLNKSDVTQNMEISELNEEEPTVSQAEEFNLSDPMASSNCSDSGTTQITFEQSTIPYSDNDSPEENKKKEEAWLHLTDTSDGEEDEDHFNKKSKSKEHFTINRKRMPRSTRKDIRYDENESSHDDNISNIDNSHQNRRHILKKTKSKVTPHKKNQVKRKQVQNLQDLNKNADENGNVPCPECGKMLKISSLKTHIEDRHTDSPGYRCALCGSVCRSRNSLNSHMSRSHRGIKSKDVPMNPIGKDSPLNAKLKKMMKKQKKKLAAK